MKTAMRILEGEFQGELLFQGKVYPFSAIRNVYGLSASFDISDHQSPPSEFELFGALEELVYGNGT